MCDGGRHDLECSSTVCPAECDDGIWLKFVLQFEAKQVNTSIAECMHHINLKQDRISDIMYGVRDSEWMTIKTVFGDAPYGCDKFSLT